MYLEISFVSFTPAEREMYFLLYYIYESQPDTPFKCIINTEWVVAKYNILKGFFFFFLALNW